MRVLAGLAGSTAAVRRAGQIAHGTRERVGGRASADVMLSTVVLTIERERRCPKPYAVRETSTMGGAGLSSR